MNEITLHQFVAVCILTTVTLNKWKYILTNITSHSVVLEIFKMADLDTQRIQK